MLRITSILIDGYSSLKDLRLEPQQFTVLIGANGQGKSLIFEALNRFFNDFNPVGGVASPGVSDSLWFKRETDSPIVFEIGFHMDKSEIKQYLPLESSYLDRLADNAKGDLSKLKVRRSLSADGNWRTELIQWGEIPLVSSDTLVSPDKLAQSVVPESLKDFKMHFFTSGNSKDNLGGDRLLVDMVQKKAFTSAPQIDELVRKGVIQSSTEYVGQNFQTWANQNQLAVSQPTPQDLANLGILTPEKLQQLLTTLATLRGKFKLVPAARDVKTASGQRSSLLETATLQNVTNMSIDRRRQIEKRWEKFRTDIQQLLGRRLDPNPTQVLLKEGDLGLLPSEIGGGEQSVMGLVFESLDLNGIVAIEEPENHLHPRLQHQLSAYLFNLAEDTQVFVSTHSPVFASKLDVSSVFLVSKDEDGKTTAEQVNETNVKRVIDELGIRPADLLEYDAVVFVEGKDDVGIFGAWAGNIAKSASRSIGFIDAEGWNNMEYYANARVLQSRRIRVSPHVIFDGDTSNDEMLKPLKERLVQQLKLPNSNVHTLKRNSIEDYLLVPAAIRRALPSLNLTQEEVKRYLESQKDKKNKKAVLDSLIKRGGLTGYDGGIGAQIARVMLDSEIDAEIKGIFNQLVSTNGESVPSENK